MEKVDVVQATRQFLLANLSVLEQIRSVEQLNQATQPALASFFIFMLNQIATNGPFRVKKLGLLPWKDLTPTQRILALRLLLWGKRADSLGENTLTKLAKARDQVQDFNSTEEIICGYLLSALVGPSEEHNSRVQDFILTHLGNEHEVGPALSTNRILY